MSTNGFGPQPEGRTAFTLLAAGRGRRFGEGKLASDLGGRPLWRWAVDAAVAAGLDDVHVVTNDPAIAAACFTHGWRAHPSPQAERGLAASIAVAIAASAHASRTILALADMPFVEPAHLARLAGESRTAFTRYPDGGRGVPAGFSGSARERLLTASGSRGAAALEWADAIGIDPDSPETCFDVDTPAALEEARVIALRLRRGASR